MKHIVVASNGSDQSGTGSVANPFATLEAALQYAEPGAQVLLRGGNYLQSARLTVGGTPDAPLIITAYDDEPPCLLGQLDRPTILQLAAPNLVVEGISFCSNQPSADRYPWIHVTAAAQNATLRNITVTRPGRMVELYKAGWKDYGIVVEGEHVTLDGCRVAGMCKGIHLKGKCLGVTVVNCHVGPTIQSNLVIGTSYGVVRGALIAHNLLEGSYQEDGIQFMPDYDAPQIKEDVSNLGTVVYHNVIRSCNENAIDLKGAGLVVLDSNILYNIVGSNDGAVQWNRRAMGAITRGARTSSRRLIERNNVIFNNSSGTRLLSEWKIYNNVFLWNNLDYTGPGSRYMNNVNPPFCGVEQTEGNVLGAAVKNNIIGMHNSADVALLMLPNSRIECDYNLYLGGRWLAKHTRRPTLFTDLAEWQAAQQEMKWPGADEHSLIAPGLAGVRFTNVAEPPRHEHTAYDFSITERSPAYRRGGPLTYTTGAGHSQRLTVQDAGYFTTWFGRQDPDLPEEAIWLNNERYAITGVSYESNTLELNRPVTWQADQPVFWGAAQPHIGLQSPEFSKPLHKSTLRLALELEVNTEMVETLRTLLKDAKVVVG